MVIIDPYLVAIVLPMYKTPCVIEISISCVTKLYFVNTLKFNPSNQLKIIDMNTKTTSHFLIVKSIPRIR